MGRLFEVLCLSYGPYRGRVVWTKYDNGGMFFFKNNKQVICITLCNCNDYQQTMLKFKKLILATLVRHLMNKLDSCMPTDSIIVQWFWLHEMA